MVERVWAQLNASQPVTLCNPFPRVFGHHDWQEKSEYSVSRPTNQAHRRSPKASVYPFWTITSSCSTKAEQYSFQTVTRDDIRFMSTNLPAYAGELELRLEFTYACSLFSFDNRLYKVRKVTPAADTSCALQQYRSFVSYDGQECAFLSTFGFWSLRLQVSKKVKSLILRYSLKVP